MYYSVELYTHEAVGLRRLLTDLKAIPNGPTILMEDNQGPTAIARYPAIYARTKYIDIQRMSIATTTFAKLCRKELSTYVIVRQMK